MNRILITGLNSFIGNAAEKWLSEKTDYRIVKITLKDRSWREFDFSSYDGIIHVAGIAHASEKKADRDLYDTINHQLTFEVAQKAKKDGIKQFIFLSSMIVYNPSQTLITKETTPSPRGPYADSKLNAENAIEKLSDKSFTVTILRPAMVYGPNSKGNFPRLINLSKRISIFPRIQNKRSMLYINHLTEAIHQLIENPQDGIFHLADKKPVSTYEIVKIIRNIHGKKTILTSMFNPLIKLFIPLSITLRKLFNDYQYDRSLIQHAFKYHISSFESSIKDSLKVSYD